MAARLAGQAGVLLGWMPDAFWAATPAGAADLARLREMYPDG